MAVKNFFSGVEGNQHYNAAVSAGATHVLTSYLHLRKGDPDIVKRRKDENPDINYLVDSGAHTLQVSTGKPPYNTWTISDYEQYCNDYVKWLKENREYLFAAVELDIDYNVGSAKVEDWQKRKFYPLQELGLDICYVWHKERGIEGWEEMCSKFGYVGLPGEMSSDADFNKYMTVARRYTTKVHGFAATKQADFRDWPWYCMTEEHTIFTKRGWLTRDEINTQDETLVRLEDGTSEWQKIEKVFVYDVKDIPITEFSSRNFNAQVTSNHGWLSMREHGRKRARKAVRVETKDLNHRDAIPRCTAFKGSGCKIYSDEFVALSAWYWTEATIGKDRGRVTISQSFKINPKKVKKIRNTLTFGGFGFCEWDGKDGCTYFQLNTETSRKLIRLFPDKVISLSFLTSLTKDQLKEFVQTSVSADGTKTPRVKKSETFHLTQNNEQRSDMFEIACILAGFPVTRTYSKNAKGYESFGVTVSNTPLAYPMHASRKEFNYTGKIWCVATKGQNFLTRCKDKVYWTGNSVDSVTWKTSEMYGTLIVWDSHKQKLIFEDDKSKRGYYRKHIQALGFDADAIIKDTAYKEVTRFALASMSAMEKFYADKYKDRTFYYELRLPVVLALLRLPDSEIWRYWKLLNPQRNFKQHDDLKNAAQVRDCLVAISAVQNTDIDTIKNRKSTHAFLSTYFHNLVEPTLADPQVFQKELSNHIAPPNPPPLLRVDASHFIPGSNVPKDRSPVPLNLEDLEYYVHEVPISIRDIE